MRYDKGGGKDEYTLEDGALSGGSYTLIKMTELNNVPAGLYHFTNGYSSGGAGTGLAYVGRTSNTDLWFDGNGNFTFNPIRPSGSIWLVPAI